jgi:hypothetical protein
MSKSYRSVVQHWEELLKKKRELLGQDKLIASVLRTVGLF